MTASVCVETVLSKLLRLLFKDALLRNHNRKNLKKNNSSWFTVQIFTRTFKISKTLVYICPFKTNVVKTIFL